MSLVPHSFTIKLCTQDLNTKPSARDFPYIYKAIDHKTFDWCNRTQDELDFMHKQGEEILQMIEDETFRRTIGEPNEYPPE